MVSLLGYVFLSIEDDHDLGVEIRVSIDASFSFVVGHG